MNGRFLQLLYDALARLTTWDDKPEQELQAEGCRDDPLKSDPVSDIIYQQRSLKRQDKKSLNRQGKFKPIVSRWNIFFTNFGYLELLLYLNMYENNKKINWKL
jgi:hypothetical protein